MTTTLATPARNAACDAVTALLNVGGAGRLRLKAGATTICDIVLNATAFGAASTGVATANGFPKTQAAAAGGTIDNFELQNNAGTVVVSGAVASSGSDINIDNPTVVNGQNITINSLTHTQPA